MSKVKNWRRRADDDDEEEPAAAKAVPSEPKPSVLKRKEVKKAVSTTILKVSSGPKLLSFAGDEEDDDGRPSLLPPTKAKKERAKEKAHSKADGDPTKRKGGYGVGHKIDLSGKEKSGKERVPTNVQAQAGEYTKEKLLELQRNTKSMVGAPKPAVDTMPAEPVVVLKGLLKPMEDPKVRGQSEVKEKVEETTSRIEYDAEKRLGLMGIGTGADSGGVTHIPDAATIAAAKARRNRLRQAQAAPDYVPLNDGEPKVVREGDREEADSSGDEGEVQGRMSFLGETNHKHTGAVFEAMAKDVELARQEDDEVDEERTWEEEQLRKGFGKRVEDVSRVVAPGGAPAGGLAPGLPSMNVGNFGYAYGRGPLEAMSIPQQAEGAWKSLQDNIIKMRVITFFLRPVIAMVLVIGLVSFCVSYLYPGF